MQTTSNIPTAAMHPSLPPFPPRHAARLLVASALLVVLGACGGGGGGASSNAPSSAGTASSSGGTASTTAADITAAILANQDVVLSGDATIALPAGATTYTGVISGQGTLRLTPASGTSSPSVFVITRASSFTLPDAQQVETVTKTTYAGMGYALDIAGSNPPVLTIDPGVTLRIGTNGSADDHPDIIATSDSRNSAALVNGEVNLDNILNNGSIELNSSQFILLGQVSGSGRINQLVNVWGDSAMGGANSFSGVLALAAGQNFGSDHVAASLAQARAVVNEGSWLLWSPPNRSVTVRQNIYEAAYGGDINFHPIGNGRIIMSGVYSHTDNSPHGSPNLVDPGLSDASLNYAKVIYRGGANDVNGNDASYRGINIEAGGTVQWGDGTHANFFLPSAPSPAAVDPAPGKKNAYINLHRGGTLAFDYNGPVTLNVGITGGGGGPDRDGSAGTGNVTVMGTAGNDVTFAQPQDYNGITTVEAGAILRLGAGQTVPLNYVTINASSGKSVQLVATYDGDASLLTAESARGAATDAIVDDGQLIVQNTSTAITLSSISGSGSLTQAGAATTTLRNDSYSGGTTIQAGGVIAGSADALGSGAVSNGGTLALASGQYELGLGADYTQKSGGTLTLAIDGATPGNNAGHLTVAGKATLAGALVLNFSGSFTSGQKIVLIDTAGGVTGAFTTVTVSGAGATVSHDTHSVYVTVN